MSVLVTGGAGYIGSHMAYALVERGEDVVVLDDLSAGFPSLVPFSARLIKGDAGDGSLVRHIIKEAQVDAVVHFAGSIVVPESVERPLAYYRNNTAVSRELIFACVEAGVRHFVFSSTAAVYGIPEQVPVAESAATSPINPYGRSKLMVEWILEDVSRAHDFHYVALRYFNVAGADPRGRTGQSNPASSHLIKRACQTALGIFPKLEIFGGDFPTPDGTGVRDYIHVNDLVAAHLLALDHLRNGGPPLVCNAGYGRGFSVLEILKAVERVTNRRLPVVLSSRRSGDPPCLISDPSRLRSALGWEPGHDDIEDIVRSAYSWELNLQRG